MSKTKQRKESVVVKYGCYLDLGCFDKDGPLPDCVLDFGNWDECMMAEPGMKKENCEYWKPV